MLRHLQFFVLCCALLTLAAWASVGCAQTSTPTLTAVLTENEPSTAVHPTWASVPATILPPTLLPPTSTLPPTYAPVPTATPTTVTLRTKSRQTAQSVEIQVSGVNGISETVKVGYLLYIPEGYGQDSQKNWPLILFLHGSEERGDDIELLRRNGLPKVLDEGRELPCLVVSPQCPAGMWWWPRVHVLSAFLDRIQLMYPIDTQRVYLTGLSMGAYGVWALALREPQRFAALVPIAGGYWDGKNSLPQNICDLENVPIWVFHGERDNIILPWESKTLVEALDKCGGNVRYTLYPEADHQQSWEQAYADPALYEWLLQQSRK
jgi:predicted peptidase